MAIKLSDILAKFGLKRKFLTPEGDPDKVKKRLKKKQKEATSSGERENEVIKLQEIFEKRRKKLSYR